MRRPLLILVLYAVALMPRAWKLNSMMRNIEPIFILGARAMSYLGGWQQQLYSATPRRCQRLLSTYATSVFRLPAHRIHYHQPTCFSRSSTPWDLTARSRQFPRVTQNG